MQVTAFKKDHQAYTRTIVDGIAFYIKDQAWSHVGRLGDLVLKELGVGSRKSEDGRRKTEDGRRKMEDGRRKTEDGNGNGNGNGRPQLSAPNSRFQIPDSRFQIPDSRLLTPDS
jgi:hypothetical protein